MGGAHSVSAARWMVGVMASVVLAFLIATVASQELEGAVADRAGDLVGNAMPSVEMMSTARGHLHRFERALERADDDPTNAELIAEAEDARHDLEVALAQYAQLPYFTGEQPLAARVTTTLAQLDGDRGGHANLAALRRDIAHVDQAMQGVVNFDADMGERIGREIERTRGEAKGAVALLDAFSVALALSAVVLALRQLRRAARERALEVEAQKRR